MNGIISLLYQLLPVAIGALFLFLIKSLNLVNPRVQIVTFSNSDILENYEYKNAGTIPIHDSHSMVKEYLTISGRLPKDSTDMLSYAINNAGIASSTNIESVPDSFKRYSPNKFTLILSNPCILSRQLSKFDQVSGVLLAYHAEEKLEIVI